MMYSASPSLALAALAKNHPPSTPDPHPMPPPSCPLTHTLLTHLHGGGVVLGVPLAPVVAQRVAVHLDGRDAANIELTLTNRIGGRAPGLGPHDTTG